MRRIAVIVFAVTWGVSLFGCTVRSRRPDGPYKHAEEFADALSDEAVACAREHAPEGKGAVVVAAEFTAEGQAPVIHDAGSMPGSEALIACVRERAPEKLRSPRSRPAPFVRVKVPVPLVTSEVTYAFMNQLPR